MLSSWKGSCGHVPQRWIFAVMALLAMMNAYTMWICLSLAITEMVKSSVTASNSTVLDETCPSTTSTSSSSSSGETYEWDEYTQGIILSSFFWSYLVSQLPGAISAEKFGGKYTFGLGILSPAVFTLLTPIVVQAYDSTGLIIPRVLMGSGGGITVPAVNSLIAQWAPPNERSRNGPVVFSGGSVGTVLGNALTGLLIEYSSIGWPIVFYFFGALGILWFFAWVVLCYSNPGVHPSISEKEKKDLRKTMSQHTSTQATPTPWRHILTFLTDSERTDARIDLGFESWLCSMEISTSIDFQPNLISYSVGIYESSREMCLQYGRLTARLAAAVQPQKKYQ